MKTLTYGQLPTQEEYSAAFDEECPDGVFQFENDKRVGNWGAHKQALWEELQGAVKEWESREAGDDEAGDWASCVLQVLGFEWV